jgi:hypothetical protein
MKTQLEKPAGSRQRFNKEYQEEAVELWKQSGRSAAKVGAELGKPTPSRIRPRRPAPKTANSSTKAPSPAS